MTLDPEIASMAYMALSSLIGQKFGKLTVIELFHIGIQGGATYSCQCECGDIVRALAYKLNKGDRSHCGKVKCRKGYKDITGQKFGKLTVIGPIEKGDRHFTVWLCQCNCGNKKEARRQNLIHGNTLSCGCMRFDKQEESIKTNSYRQHCAGAKQRKILNHLSKEEYLFIASKPCHYCKDFDIKNNRATNFQIKLNGIDRKNNEKYYKIENSLSCCKNCNMMKRTMLYNGFITHIRKITNNY